MIKHILSFAEDGEGDRDMILVWEGISVTGFSLKVGLPGVPEIGEPLGEKRVISHKSTQMWVFLELSDSLQFKPGGSCFPSLISWTSGLSVCLTDSYLQKFFFL